MNRAQRVIKAAGGNKIVSDQLDVSTVTIWKWGQNDKIPADYVQALCKLTDGLISPEQVRPDIFGAQ